MAEKKASRYGFIDAVRGIAACAVMLQHSLYASKLLRDFPSARLTGFIPTWLELGETGVVAFFLVSGFVIPLSLEKTGNFGSFWFHRVLRIYPLYLVVLAVGLVLTGADFLKNGTDLLYTIGTHLLFIQEYLPVRNFVGGSWTLSLELVWYFVISGMFLLSLNRNLTLLITGSLLTSAACWIICSSGHHVPMGRLSMLLCCVTGFVCYRRERGDLSRRAFYRLLGLMATTIVLNLAVGDVVFPSKHPTSSFAMAFDSWSLAAIVFFVPFATRDAEFWRRSTLAFLGRISYSVYLLHPVVLFILGLIPIEGVALVVCTFALTIPLSALTYRFVELPPIRFGHRRRIVSEAV